MLEIRADRDGHAAALEPSGISSSSNQPKVPPRSEVHHRSPELPHDILIQSLAEKVLDGWLQNKHQTLVPLAMNLGRLSPAQIEVLMNFAAVALLGGSSSRETARGSVIRWLRSVGAAADAIEDFEAAIDAPRPVSLLLQAIHEHELGPYAYAAAVVASDQHEVAGRLFSNYVAARLALPADAVRSIDRRHRR